MNDTSSKTLKLGLQGAGSYGAFTWGVLDRLLDEDEFVFDSLSGSSSGAINSVVFADGYAHGGGRRGAQQALQRFWRALGGAAAFSPLQQTPLDRLAGRWSLEHSPTYHLMEMAGALGGPVRESPFTLNPLRNLLSTLVDFERVHACHELQLFVCATSVRSGAGRIFTRPELNVQTVLASACLPTVFAGVEVEGESYWDGSYVANPPLTPFLARPGRDILLIQNSPPARLETPRTLADISNRSNEIAFHSSLVRELNAIGSAAAAGNANSPLMHLISGVALLAQYGISSKFNAELAFLEHLHGCGRQAADAWLAAHRGDIGVRSSMADIVDFTLPG